MSLHGVWQSEWSPSLYWDIFCFSELSTGPMPTCRAQLEPSLPKLHLEGGLAFPIEWTSVKQKHGCQPDIKTWDGQVIYSPNPNWSRSQCLVFTAPSPLPHFTVSVLGIACICRLPCHYGIMLINCYFYVVFLTVIAELCGCGLWFRITSSVPYNLPMGKVGMWLFRGGILWVPWGSSGSWKCESAIVRTEIWHSM